MLEVFLIAFAMSFLACLTATPFIRASLGRRHHYRCLQSISRLERELGLLQPPDVPAAGARRPEDFAMSPGAVWPVNHVQRVSLLGAYSMTACAPLVDAVGHKRALEVALLYAQSSNN